MSAMSTKDRPNILLITTDTQRWDTLHCMGSEFAVSPNADRLAKEGVVFRQAHTASPVCQPARCSLLTGQHTHVHGCTENGISRRTDLPVFTDYLKEQGYHNILVGKSHFDPIPESFDVTHTVDEKGRNTEDCYAEYLRQFGLSRTQQDIPEEHYMDTFLVGRTIEEIEKARTGSDAPFFAFCSLISPHAPAGGKTDPPGDWGRLYDDVDLLPLNYVPGEEDRYPEHLRRLVGRPDETEREHLTEKMIRNLDNRGSVTGVGPEEIENLRRLYYGLASYVDFQVGRLITYLEENGLRENTLVILTSDHGAQLFDHGFDNKHNYYDASWRVPFIMSMPETLPRDEIREFAVWTDIPATVLGAAGTACDAFQGFDLFTPLSEGRLSPRTCAVGTLYKSAALATSRWKLEYYFEEGTGRLFDREADPHEQHDLFDQQQYAGIRDHLVKTLLLWRADSCDTWYTNQHTNAVGAVARRVALHASATKGTDAEERLQKSLKGY